MSLRHCDPTDAKCIVYVAKFLRFDTKRINLCRVLSGTLHNGATVEFHVPSPPSSTTTTIKSTIIRVQSIYIMLGRELIAVERAPAGRICALETADGDWIGGQVLLSHPACSVINGSSEVLR